MRRNQLGVAVLVVLWIAAGFPSAAQEPTAAADAGESDIVAHFHLSGVLTETPQEDPFGLMMGQMTSLKSLLERIEKAREDDQVKAIVLTYDTAYLGLAQMEEIRDALMEFRTSGKPVYAYVDSTYLSAPLYAMLSAASDFVIDPMADIWITGLYAESLYAKSLLDKIGVKADFMQFEEYKSAAEIFTHTGPSDPAKENMNWLLDSLYASLIEMIADSRGVSEDRAHSWVDSAIHIADRATSQGLVDGTASRPDFVDSLKSQWKAKLQFDNRYGVEDQLTVDFANPFAFFSIFSQMMAHQKKPKKDAVGVVYVEGTILPGYEQPSLFGASGAAYSGNIRHALQQAGDDDSVKAVVVRVDSPGGSVLGSDIILRAVTELMQKKPVIVSMGNVAASGGYYVSCRADEIYADRMTITASIGVVGGKLVTQGLWSKLGINWVGYARGENADLFSTEHLFTENQRAIFREWMADRYEVFKKLVVEGRGDKLTKPIEELAGGRVFSGEQAKDLGLIDEIGGLYDAVERAAERAGVAEYEVRVVPRPKNPIETLMEALSGEEGQKPSDLEASAGISLTLSQPELESVFGLLKHLDPPRAAALVRTLQRVELIRREGVALVMPGELLFR